MIKRKLSRLAFIRKLILFINHSPRSGKIIFPPLHRDFSGRLHNFRNLKRIPFKMNYFFAFLLIFLPSCLFAQGYKNIGVAIFNSSKMGTQIGPTVGVHFPTGTNGTIGATADFFIFDKNKIKMVPAYVDVSIYFRKLETGAAPFISLRPGYVICNDRLGNIRNTGSFAMSAYLGGYIKPCKIGTTFGFGYSYLEIISRNGIFKLTQRTGGFSGFINLAF